MPRTPDTGSDGPDIDGDVIDLGLIDGPDERSGQAGDLGGIGDDGPGDQAGRAFDLGTGLTTYERELADERERIRGLEATRNRLERSAGISQMGLGGGRPDVDYDTLAIIDAAGRFGSVAEQDGDRAAQERASITEALALHATQPSQPLDEYRFFGIITKQATDSEGDIALSIKVPWSHREEVFRALETMPFTAKFVLSEIAPVRLESDG